MKDVKKQMIQMVTEEYHDFNLKLPKSMVKMLTLFLLHPGVLGETDGLDVNFVIEGPDNKNWRWWTMVNILFMAYRVFLFAFGLCNGYTKRVKIGWYYRRVRRFFQVDNVVRKKKTYGESQMTGSFEKMAGTGILMERLHRRPGQLGS